MVYHPAIFHQGRAGIKLGNLSIYMHGVTIRWLHFLHVCTHVQSICTIREKCGLGTRLFSDATIITIIMNKEQLRFANTNHKLSTMDRKNI